MKVLACFTLIKNGKILIRARMEGALGELCRMEFL